MKNDMGSNRADSTKHSDSEQSVATKSIPLVQTKEDYIKAEQERGHADSVTFELLFAIAGMRSGFSSKPTYNDQHTVSVKAHKDINNMDFSEMYDYIDSLVQIADQWQEYAEHYFSELKALGATFDENGYVWEVDTSVNDPGVNSNPPTTTSINEILEGGDSESPELHEQPSRNQVGKSNSGAYHDGYRDGYQTAKHEFEQQSIKKFENENYQ